MPPSPNAFLAAMNERRPLVADGPMGTRLASIGLPPGELPERWMLTPEGRVAVGEVHRSYVDAGARIVLTNTFGANPIRLGLYGLRDRVQEVVEVAAALAREAAGKDGLVAGSVGPTGELLEPIGTLTFPEATEGFERQAAALSDGGVDVIWIETMSDLEEVRAAVTASRRAAPSLPIVVTWSFGAGPSTIMGVGARKAAELLVELGVDGGGANCGTSSAVAVEALDLMRDASPMLPLVGKPNAGVPTLRNGSSVYPETAADLAAATRRFLAAGASIVGVCCGGTPEHVRAIAEVVATGG